MQDVVVVNLQGGVPSALIERAFAQLPGFSDIAARGLLWSHGVVTHCDADAALEAWMEVPECGSLFDAYRRAGYHTIYVGAPCSVARDAETRCEIPQGTAADVHDTSSAFHALRWLLDERSRPRFVLVCLECCADVLRAERVSRAARAFSVAAEASRLPPSVYGDDVRNAASSAHRFRALVDASDDAPNNAGEHAARLHTVAWAAMQRADSVLRTVQRALAITVSRSPLLAVMGTCSVALREHGVVGSGGHWDACTRSFFAVYTGCTALHERRPVSMGVFSHVLLDISGIPQGSAVSPAWNPPDGIPVTVRAPRTTRGGVDPFCFVRSVVSRGGRLFAWSVWFGTSIAHDVRSQFGALDMDSSQHLVTHAVYDLSSDPDEMAELWSETSWRRTPLAKLLWEQVRKCVVSLPELTMRVFRATTLPSPALASPLPLPTKPPTTPIGPLPVVLERRVVVPPTADVLETALHGVPPEDTDDDDHDDDQDSWCSGPASAVELNSRAMRTQ